MNRVTGGVEACDLEVGDEVEFLGEHRRVGSVRPFVTPQGVPAVWVEMLGSGRPTLTLADADQVFVRVRS